MKTVVNVRLTTVAAVRLIKKWHGVGVKGVNNSVGQSHNVSAESGIPVSYDWCQSNVVDGRGDNITVSLWQSADSFAMGPFSAVATITFPHEHLREEARLFLSVLKEVFYTSRHKDADISTFLRAVRI